MPDPSTLATGAGLPDEAASPLSGQRAGAYARREARILAHILKFALLLLLACFLVFAALDLLPGNAAIQTLGFNGTTEQIEALARQWGLDAPLFERFASWLVGALSGDFGQVLSTGKPVAEAMAGPLARTAVLFAASFAATCVLGVALGTAAGLAAGRAPDRIVSTAALVVRSLPEFIVAVLLMFVLATELGLLPAVSLIPVGRDAFDDPSIFVLPIIAMTFVGTSSVVRPVRAVVQRENQSLHVEATRLAGVGEARVVLRHVLPACAAPIAQALAQVVPYLVGGAVVVESVFSFPGLGTMLVSAVMDREPNVLMACALVMITVSLAAFWAADLLGGGYRGREDRKARTR